MILAPLSERNPVLRAERKHQWYVMENSRAGTVWIVLAALMLIPALIVSVIMFVGAIISPWVPGAFILFDFDLPLPELAFADIVTMNVAMYVVVSLITMGLAVNSIAREKKGKTWETLLLTSVSSRQIVWGKWWATLQALWGDHAMIAGVRFGLLAIVLVGLDSSTALPPLLPGLPVIPPHILLFGVLMLAYTAADAGLTAALGVLAALLPVEGAASMIIAFGGRILFTVGLVLFPWLVWIAGWGRYYLAFGIIGLAVYGALIALVLLVAQVFAVRNHAASPVPTP
ncbi:MAG: hypothetical protein H6672_03480 [Anaerolineaceae bacterium]|nr:hypothetical protein [Anaerolineaceae bacterium]